MGCYFCQVTHTKLEYGRLCNVTLIDAPAASCNLLNQYQHNSTTSEVTSLCDLKSNLIQVRVYFVSMSQKFHILEQKRLILKSFFVRLIVNFMFNVNKSKRSFSILRVLTKNFF